MLRRRLIANSVAGMILATTSLALPQERNTSGVKTGYAPVNCLKLYYEIHGAGNR